MVAPKNKPFPQKLKLIFIDANIYLRFFDTNSQEFKKLLKSVKEIKSYIFITDQIKNEVTRNKLDVFRASFANYTGQIKTLNVQLPEHLNTDTNPTIKQWNKKTKTLNTQISQQQQTLQHITTHLIDKISNSTDKVSKTLHKIFAKALPPTEEQVSRAKNRKGLGNPPGKKNDPIGDQLNWEQLLEETKTIKHLWIIANDKDYMFQFKEKCYLNTFLLEELKKNNPSIIVECYNTLSSGLSSFNNSEAVASLPNATELTKIKNEETNIPKKYPFSNDIFTLSPRGSGYSGYSGYIGSTGFDIYGIANQNSASTGYSPEPYTIYSSEFHPGLSANFLPTFKSNCPTCGSPLINISSQNDDGSFSPKLYCAICQKSYETK